ncbi:UDP-N-acetylmuramoyl-tripeptide--D-alanyl-D-alanine ligase [filamentous cyanobacterium CCP5]|nr:UDP-N-acetylmuramoyl-tripeptide--D-alanyl-D-alanine ligase [filamentous cyanobacterium CCP5]
MGFDANLAQIARVLSLPACVDSLLDSDLKVKNITTDTRGIRSGDLFVALQGTTYDGHDFVSEAIAQGAVAAVVHRELPPQSAPLLRVPDTLAAYQAIARWWRQRLPTAIVAITGSVGKTTTKELIAAALATHGQVGKTEANFNNEIGVPKTLLQLDSAHRFGVIEMGMRGPKEIALLTHIAQPDIAVITNVGTAHIGRLGSEQAIANAKCELLAELPPKGVAILNHDCSRLIATAAGIWSGRTITYGLEGGDLQGRLLDEHTLEVQGIPLPLPLSGRHNALNYLAAIAVLVSLDLDWTFLQAGLSIQLPPGRNRRIDLPGDLLLLDQTYNAGLESMEAALELLGQIPGQRRLAVLGTMKELGDHSVSLHRRVGATVRRLGLDGLYILADPEEAAALAAGADPVPSQQFAEPERLVASLRSDLRPGDRVLFKASRSVALDRVVKALEDTWT